MVNIGVTIKQRNGKIKKTTGLNHGYLGWRKFEVEVQDGNFYNDTLVFNRDKLAKNGNRVHLTINPIRKKEIKKRFFIQVPYITDLKIDYDTSAFLALGFAIPLQLTARYNNDKVYQTQNNTGAFHLHWQSFTLFVNNQPEHNNYVYIPRDTKEIMDTVRVFAFYNYNDSINCHLNIPLNYKADYTFNFSGFNGSNGYKGNNASGTYQGNGNDGEDGSDGSDGGNGEDIEVFVESDLLHEDTLLRITACSRSTTEFAIINASGGSLLISNKGGNGGYVGEGGDGSDGEDETDSTAAGYGGNGGRGGYGGNGGNGGDVVFYADSVAGFFLNRITVENTGGQGGLGGRGDKKGGGGMKYSGKKGWTLLGIILGVRSGGKGNDGSNGYNGNNGNIEVHYIHNDELERKKLKYKF